MNKWADYGITKVKYNQARTHIDSVELRPDNGETLGSAAVWARSQVVTSIKSGKTFITILKGTDDKWKQGQDVHLVAVSGVEYIRSDKNNRAADNLENLPEF